MVPECMRATQMDWNAFVQLNLYNIKLYHLKISCYQYFVLTVLSNTYCVCTLAVNVGRLDKSFTMDAFPQIFSVKQFHMNIRFTCNYHFDINTVQLTYEVHPGYEMIVIQIIVPREG